jgi:small subunit ribosomal protein S7
MGRITASRKMLESDPTYGSILAGKFINCLMWSGKKSVAQNVFYGALELVKQKIPDVEPIEVFTQAVENVKPNIEVRSKRVGGASYQVPMQVNRNRQQSLAIRWILLACREKKGRPMHEKLAPDPKFGSLLASKFINSMMWSGKKSVTQNVFYDALDLIHEKIKDVEPIDVFTQALENVKPNIEVRSKRVGGASYQVPMQVNRNRQQSLAIRWILGAVREKKGRPTSEKLAAELMAAYNREGAAMTKRENVHRMAEANKAFAHFAW